MCSNDKRLRKVMLLMAMMMVGEYRYLNVFSDTLHGRNRCLRLSADR